MRGSTGATRAGFSVTVVATLALGIGVASAAISLLHALVLRPLDVSDPEGLVAAISSIGAGVQVRSRSPPRSRSRGANHSKSVSAYTGGGLIQTEIDGRGVVMRTIEAVTPRCYEMLGVKPILGRLFSSEDIASAAAAPVTVISHAVWQREFNGRTEAIGRTILVQGQPLTIIGVTPPNFAGLRVEIAPELAVTTPMLGVFCRRPIPGRLCDPRRHRQAESRRDARPGRGRPARDVGVAARATGSANPGLTDLQPAGIVIESIARGFSSLRPRTRRPRVLVGLTILLLAIGCLNLSSMLVTTVARRALDLSGARRGTVAAGAAAPVPESAALARGRPRSDPDRLVGGAYAGRADLDRTGPDDTHVTPDGRVLVAMGVIAAAAAVVITSVPAFIITRRIGFHAQLRERRAHNRALGNIGRVLIAAQVTLSVALLFTNVLLVRTLVNVRAVDFGFQTSGVVLAKLAARLDGYLNLDETTYYPELVGRLVESAGVSSVALARGFGAPATDRRPVARSGVGEGGRSRERDGRGVAGILPDAPDPADSGPGFHVAR